MKWDYDVIVVGAGPGGATASRYCAQAGLRTLLIEKEHLPRYKACGGCLSLKTVRLLGLDLSPVIENTIYGVRFTYCLRDPLPITSEEPIALMVRRNRFDQFLVDHSLQPGVELAEGKKVIGARDLGEGIEVEWEGGTRSRCTYLIGADGPGSTVARSFSLLPPKAQENGVGLESEVPYESMVPMAQEDLHRVHLDFGRIPNGYGWVFPKKEVVSIGIGGTLNGRKRGHLRKYFDDFVKDLNLIKEGRVDRTTGHRLPCFYDEAFKISWRNVVLVGDAGYLMDPLTGEGIYYAIRSGMLAAEAIIQSKEQGIAAATLYQERIRKWISEDLKWALHISRILYRFPKLSYQTLKQYPELARLCMEMLAGQASYPVFVTRVKDRIKDLLKGKLGETIRKAMATG
jgi:geranylgeranyl reductase family protein